MIQKEQAGQSKIMTMPYGRNNESYSFLNAYNKMLKLKAMTISTLITPWSLLGVTSMPLAPNTAVADWPSIGRS